ncbi:Surface polysaccharide O-acyltransferase, integral membrane enzyme [Xylanibacter ruminicola]|uniref:acyltransferase family protein n=1 Tax=Xylanibacter ruminicola TaxID=839 RepID=UPI0008DFDBC7|nr:acyltransferase family protein [Xylanibacter ruminicola]SFC13079.1 Surface polysaccharide O-acyltransferase, integral membrane enzyme [Xylanibacter ruminicola]
MNKRERNNLTSKSISILRFPLTIGVVFIHFSLSKGLNIHGTFYGINNPDWFFFVTNFISEVLARLCVPSFFFISGFLFFNRDNFNKKIYFQKLNTRMRSLFIPFILWNIIAAAFILCKSTIPLVSNYYPPIDINFSFVRLLNTFLCNSNNSGILVYPSDFPPPMDFCPINIPLWYVRELMIMVLLSPLVYWIIKKEGRYAIIIIGFIWYTTPFLLPESSYFPMFIQALFFFSWGAFYNISKIDFIHQFRKGKWLFFTLYPIIAITDTLTKEFTYSICIHTSGLLFGVPFVFTLTSYLIENWEIRPRQIFIDSCFFIYAFHSLFMNDAAKFAFKTLHIPENVPFIMLVFYLSVPIITIGLCISIYVILRSISPPFCKILTGIRMSN